MPMLTTPFRNKKPAPVVSYAERHVNEFTPVYYDEELYRPNTYHSFIWELERPRLLRIIRGIGTAGREVKYLDFACGTGRIISAVAPLVAKATGLDISPQM